MVEPIAVVDRPGRKLDIRLVLDDFVLTETRHEEGEPGADPHVHRHHVDCFYVLDGALRISRTDGDHVFTAGQFVLVPPNVVHGFRNHGPGELRFLNLHTPARASTAICGEFCPPRSSTSILRRRTKKPTRPR